MNYFAVQSMHFMNQNRIFYRTQNNFNYTIMHRGRAVVYCLTVAALQRVKFTWRGENCMTVPLFLDVRYNFKREDLLIKRSIIMNKSIW